MLLPKSELGRKLRLAAIQNLLRYYDADITLADSIVQRNDNPKDLEWISKRVQGKVVRNTFTSTCGRHGVHGRGYADCTNAIYTPLFGGGADVVRAKHGLTEKQSTRDNMTMPELTAVQFAEIQASDLINRKDIKGNEACSNAALQASTVVREAILKIKSL